MSVSYFKTMDGVSLAYVHLKATPVGVGLPAVLFFGGFKSDMEGTKALYLQEKCAARGQEFMRFDYSGHGQSEGMFEDGSIGAWARDASDILELIEGDRVVFVGSSMGGWIALRLLLDRPKGLVGVVGIAAAPDFTKDIEAQMSAEQRVEMARSGRLLVPNDYSDEPYIFTRILLEDGARQCVLEGGHDVDVPVLLVQGKLDADVAWEKAQEIKACFKGPDTRIFFVDDGDHRLSRAQDLALIWRLVEGLV